MLDKQRVMCALVAERMTHGSLLPLNHTDFRRVQKPTICDARMTEQLERKQHADQERQVKHKLVERLSRVVLQFHAHTSNNTTQNSVIWNKPGATRKAPYSQTTYAIHLPQSEPALKFETPNARDKLRYY